MRCSQTSMQREIYNYKHLHEKKKSQIKSLSVYLKKLGVGDRKRAIKLKPKQAEVKQL